MNDEQKRDYLYQLIGNVFPNATLHLNPKAGPGLQVMCEGTEFGGDGSEWVITDYKPDSMEEMELYRGVSFNEACQVLVRVITENRMESVFAMMAAKQESEDVNYLEPVSSDKNPPMPKKVFSTPPVKVPQDGDWQKHDSHVAGSSMFIGDIPVADIDKQDPEEQQEAINRLRAAGRGSGKSRMVFKKVMQPVGEWVNDRMLQIEIVFRSHVSEMHVDQISEISKEYFKLKDWKDAVCSLDHSDS